MTLERIEEMLKTYRFEVGRCGHLANEITQLEKDIAWLQNNPAEELCGPSAQVITDMPRGTSVGNPTERIGLMLAAGYESQDVREMRIKLAEMKAEYAERRKTVDYVESWLAGLPERERWMIEMQVIDGVIWREIITKYPEKFGEYRSKNTLKRIRDRAMEMICDMADG